MPAPPERRLGRLGFVPRCRAMPVAPLTVACSAFPVVCPATRDLTVRAACVSSTLVPAPCPRNLRPEEPPTAPFPYERGWGRDGATTSSKLMRCVPGGAGARHG